MYKSESVKWVEDDDIDGGLTVFPAKWINLCIISDKCDFLHIYGRYGSISLRILN